MTNQKSITQLNKYFQKCAEASCYDHDFEKIVTIACVLISEARNIVFPLNSRKTCLLIESKIIQAINSKDGNCEHLHLAANIFGEIARHRFPSQTTIDHYLVATLSALNLGWKFFDTDKDNQAYPKVVHIETQAVCNAKCSFCEYDNLERKGVKMSDENIIKIISDLSVIPMNRGVQIQPYKISEPFLEKRLPWIIDEVLDKIPGSNIRLISNGNLMTEGIIDWLVNFNNFKNKQQEVLINLSISLNTVEKGEYEKLMNINYERTIKNISLLHKRLDESQNKGLKVNLTRVSTSPDGDLLFAKECQKIFPNFEISLLKLNDWFSHNEDSKNKLNEIGVSIKSFQKLGCNRWSDLSIAADGSVALCCMDAGIEELGLGNVFEDNALDLYRRKNLRFVPSSGLRGDGINPCNSCSYFQNAGNILIPSLKKILITT
jgi:MoaA/NifB/PqqE/SkfB family radical SAM enzyme